MRCTKIGCELDLACGLEFVDPWRGDSQRLRSTVIDSGFDLERVLLNLSVILPVQQGGWNYKVPSN